MVDYDVSYKLNDDLKKYILEKYNHVFTEVAEKQNKTRNEILIENAQKAKYLDILRKSARKIRKDLVLEISNFRNL